MSTDIVLRARDGIDGDLALDAVAPDRLAALSEGEIAHLRVWQGRRELHLGDVFDVHGGRARCVRVEGMPRNVEGLGAGMGGGELFVQGDGGRRVAAGMRGGAVLVEGSVDDDAGVGMQGGVLRVDGDAGERLGAALPGASRGMTGGEIVVRGRAGSGAGARMRRGIVVILGDAGVGAGEDIIAGTVIVFGAVAAGAALGVKRGTLVVMGAVAVPLTFRYACSYQPSWLALALTYLGRRYGIAIEASQLHGTYRRWTGDHAELGRGEILQWTGR